MNNILDEIMKRIKRDEASRFATFDPDHPPLRPRRPPIDVLPLLDGTFFPIAEIKRASPSCPGGFRPDFSVGEIARTYSRNGAAAISVVTEKNFFRGNPEDIPAVRHEVRLPLLRKDFIFHPLQIYDSYNLGADFILLIVACLGDSELKRLFDLASSLGMRSLIEVHDRQELDRAIHLGPRLIGINNRNLRDLSVDWRLSLELRERIPPGINVISESGLNSPEKVRELKKSGFSGILVGEYLLRQEEPGRTLKELLHG